MRIKLCVIIEMGELQKKIWMHVLHVIFIPSKENKGFSDG